ncbi:MAG: HAD hydrolase-like protein [Akkermansiaceae bacterium]
MREAVIFDFDGTLADTLEAGHRIFNRLAPEFGLRRIETEEIPDLRHLKLREILKTLEIKKRYLPTLLRRGKSLLREELHSLKPCPGVFEQLEKMRSVSKYFGILTSNSVENVEFFLNRHEVRGHFDFIASCRKLQGKAKYLKSIARTYSMKPEAMLYVGDEVRDVKASKKAGVPMIAVTWGFNSEQALREGRPDWMVDDAEALGQLVACPNEAH